MAKKAKSKVRVLQGSDTPATNNALVNNVEQEKELVAISFISPEDLERTHAPNGFLREVEPDYLHTQKESRTHHIADALLALEGRPSRSQKSAHGSTTSLENGGPAGLSLMLGNQIEATNPQLNGLRRRSSIRDLFRRTKSEPQLQSSKSGILTQSRDRANMFRI